MISKISMFFMTVINFLPILPLSYPTLPHPVCRLHLAIPISKRDGLQERDTMFRDFSGATARGPAQENGVDSLLASRGSKPEQARPRPPPGTQRACWEPLM